MRYLATFLLFCVAYLSYSQEVSYDSLQNINKNNYTQLVGQTLYAPKGELVVRNLFWSNKSGKIYKPHPDWVLYPKYSTPDDVLNKHYLIEKVITKSTPLLKTRIKETDDVVYINLDALLNYTTSPVMFVDGYIQKCRQQFLNRHLYIDKTKYKRSLPSSFNTKVPNLASFYCNNIRVTTTTSQNYGGLLLLSDRVTSSTPTEMSVVDYLRSQVSKSKADEMIRQREIELAPISEPLRLNCELLIGLADELNISGPIQIHDNSGGDVYLEKRKEINVTGALTDGTHPENVPPASECFDFRGSDRPSGNIAHLVIDGMPLLFSAGRDPYFLFHLLKSADPL